ncbi:Mediator of RNA polymerase II transcription subunit 16 [Neofusicoccum ribis]|uniref:Mediator of RNA polymerase II transcription subunit 16 n=1 Tax=Neofusicoccum ribis TaxID=45134 RepID=A0ABR3T6V5_9PEZI
MPLIMDDDQYMDLFNEAEQIPITVAAPPVRRLAQRLDELGESGCSQKIAWSKSGCVASITRDGRGVNLRAFQRSTADGKWVLGDEAPLHIPSVHEEFPLVHVSWGHLGVDLAVVDAAGRILIYTAAQAADRMKLSREPYSDHESESNALVGKSRYLPPSVSEAVANSDQYHMIWSADRNEDKWQYRMTSHPWKEPYNPVHLRMSLGAFICFTRGGTVRLLYQQPDQQWYEATAEIEASNSGKDAFTHASFTSDSGNFPFGLSQQPTDSSEQSLLLATHTVSGSIIVYRVKINWNAQPGRSASPTFDISPLKAEDNCAPLGTDFDTGDAALGSSAKLSFPAKLTHLFFVPTGPEPSPSPSHPTVLAQKTNLKRLPDVVLGSATLGFFSLDFHTRFALYQSTGGVEFRDRYSMEIINADLNENKVSSLPQAGFSFTATDPALHMVLSPSACMLALLQQDGTITLKNMEFCLGSLNSGDNDPLVLQYSSASLQYMFGDDIFAIMPADMDYNLKRLFLRGTHHCMNVVADYPPEDASQKSFEAIFRNNVLRGCLSTQNLLGMTANGSRTLSSKLAWITLSLRFTSFLLSIPTNQARGETAKSVAGLLKWTMDLMVYMMNDLIELSHDCKKHEADRGFVQKKLSSPVHPPHIAALVADVDNQVRICYNKAQYSDERRKATEREMLISAEIPDVLMPVVTRLLTHGMDKLLDSVDPAKVMYWDLRWLGLSEDKRERQYLENNVVDVLRKIVISAKDGRRRRCVRCGSEMEDMDWMGGQNKCACGSPWAMGSYTKKH